MSGLSRILPPPSLIIHDRDAERQRVANESQRAVVSRQKQIPPYGHRSGYIPRIPEDYGDGGAFPEIPVAQYPLEMGRKRGEKTNALAVAVDEAGSIKYDALLRQGQRADKVIHSKYQDLVPKPIRNESAPELQKPDEEEIAKLAEETRQALQVRVDTKIAAAMPVRRAEAVGPDQYVRYTPSQQGDNFNSGAKQRIVRVVEQQNDPMEPPKFKINKKLPKPPPSPPAPVMHSPPRKVTVQEQADWKIPPCISNWKNAKGYTIPLDKRLAADGRGLQQVHINENFAKFAEALYIADRKAREAVEARSQLERRLAQKEKERKEENLRQLAQKAREERAGIRSAATAPEEASAEEVREREQLRLDRHKERARDRNIQRAAPDKRTKLQRERERDISEKIALGIPAKVNQGDDSAFDQRLFNQSRGMDSGFGGGEDESYNVYDKAWRSEKNIGQSLYRPNKNVDKEVYGDDFDEIVKTNRFVPDKGFEGADRAQRRDGPVQFERHAAAAKDEREADPFGLDKFLGEAKKGAKRNEEERRRGTPERDRDYDRKKRRGS
ncbi:SNW domain-containing protein 1-like [Paramacrobiotus metropolitanus]|uniref:SNW domain-containing protein 1-like n=1 Tax=Paramacrobiotus metropolitanus TaxID=2943436 RepID=UPI002445DFBC|nr:SNW domain-containing protein 1-like [Paramacrobiotus metropolitanus]